jgi:hypothetical protein
MFEFLYWSDTSLICSILTINLECQLSELFSIKKTGTWQNYNYICRPTCVYSTQFWLSLPQERIILFRVLKQCINMDFYVLQLNTHASTWIEVLRRNICTWILWYHKPYIVVYVSNINSVGSNTVNSYVLLFTGCPTPPQSRRRFFLSPKSLRNPWNQRGCNGPRVPSDSIDNPSALSGELCISDIVKMWFVGNHYRNYCKEAQRPNLLCLYLLFQLYKRSRCKVPCILKLGAKWG